MNHRKLWIVIPARIGSTRLPRKCLLPLAGKPLIQFVGLRAKRFAENCAHRFQRQFGEVQLWIATDSDEIKQVLHKANLKSVMTPPECASGTDRVAAALESLGTELNVHEDDLVLNIQGDEPFFSEQDLYDLIEFVVTRPEIPLGTLAYWNVNQEDFAKPSNVKVVLDDKRNALYFSRSQLPWSDAPLEGFWHHLGVYLYRVKSLKSFTHRLQPSALEKVERLEQLRALSAGWKVFVGNAQKPAFGIDTADDLERAQEIAQKMAID